MNIRGLKLAVVSGALLLGWTASPGVQAQEGIGVVSLEFALQQTEYFRKELLVLEQEREYKILEEKGEKLIGELRKLQEQFTRDIDTMTQRQSEQLEKSISTKATALRELQVQVEGQQKVLWDKALLELNPLMQEAVQEVIQARSLRLLVNRQAVLYADEIIDITADVTKVVNRLHSRRASRDNN